MFPDITLLQTIEDRESHLVELMGPFPCADTTAWFGQGWYYWDGDERIAHAWGKMRHGAQYIITSCVITKTVRLWDLLAENEHREEWRRIKDDFRKRFNAMNPKMVDVINFMKRSNNFPYEGVRAPIKYVGNKGWLNGVLRGTEREKGTFHRSPGIFDPNQVIVVCLYQKLALNLRSYKIIYPQEYVGDEFV